MRRSGPARLLSAALLALLGLCWPVRPADAGGKVALRVFAAASLTDAFGEIAHAFEKRHPGVSVQLSFAGSQQLVAQIEQGTAADVFASADDRWMGYAHDRGLLAGPSTAFAHNRLVGIIPRSNPARIRRLQDFARGGIKFVTSPEAVPVGHYTRAALANLSRTPGFDPDYSSRVLANIVSEEENVKSIVGKVQLGEADAAFVYQSDVTPSLARYVRTLEIPEAANVMASYPIAIPRSATRPEEAKAFLDLVLSADGQAILKRWAFIPASATGP